MSIKENKFSKTGDNLTQIMESVESINLSPFFCGKIIFPPTRYVEATCNEYTEGALGNKIINRLLKFQQKLSNYSAFDSAIGRVKPHTLFCF